jgi:hypothetical protein
MNKMSKPRKNSDSEEKATGESWFLEKLIATVTVIVLIILIGSAIVDRLMYRN